MQRQPVIGVLTPIIGGNYYTTLMQSLQRSAMESGVKLVYIVTGGKYFDVPIGLDYVDGWIVINYAVEDHYLQELAHQHHKPIVTIGKEIRPLKIDGSMVMTNNEQGIEQAIQHLFEHGHRKIGFLGSLSMDDMQQRFRGYLTAMNRLGLDTKQEYIFDYGDMSVFGGRQAAEKIINNKYDLTAVVCCTDMCAHGMIETLEKEGYNVPEDIAIVGFDNSPTAAYSIMPITSIAQHIPDVAKVAMEEIISRLTTVKPFTLRLVDTHLVVRESCGCQSEIVVEDELINTISQADDLCHEQNMSYEFNRYISDYKVMHLRDLSQILHTFFETGCIAVQDGYNNEKEPRLYMSEYYHFKKRKSLLNNINFELFNNLSSFPPMLACEKEQHQTEVIYIIPYRLTQNNWSLLAFGTTHQKSVMHETDFMRIVNIIDTISSTFDRLSLIDEVKHSNQQHITLKERYDIINRISEDIWFEVDFKSKTVWASRDIVVEPKQSMFLGLEDYIHPNDISEIKKHFYEHYRDNKPFFMEIRVKNVQGHYYSAYVTGESSRDKLGKIQKLVGTIRDVMTSGKQLQHHSDQLPSIISRREFYSEIKRIMITESTKFALLVIDIDNFKIINDTYGIQLGDEIIDILFDVLSQSIKPEDRISRFGGDEFIILYHFTDIKQVDQFAQHILLTSTAKVNEIQQDLKLSVSMGYSIFPDDGEEYEDLMRKSDIALFHMKNNGKSNYQRFELSMVDYQQDKRHMEKLIRDALAFDGFKLYYQPQVHIQTRKVAGIEVLLRLISEDGTMVSPEQFIPVAEKLGLIIPIGEWVLRATCKQAVDWLASGYAPLRLSINISGHQLKSVQFINSVKQIIEETGVNPSLLTFEITETTIIEQTEHVMYVIEELKRLGISIAIDDFGISYSSLSVLKDFPIDILKIDKSFIREMTKDQKGYKIVNAIINIGKSLDMKIVAEGVETVDQLNLLNHLECNFCQGYLISKPVSKKEIETFLTIPHAIHRK